MYSAITSQYARFRCAGLEAIPRNSHIPKELKDFEKQLIEQRHRHIIHDVGVNLQLPILSSAKKLAMMAVDITPSAYDFYHTIHYLACAASGNNCTPSIVGKQDAVDRKAILDCQVVTYNRFIHAGETREKFIALVSCRSHVHDLELALQLLPLCLTNGNITFIISIIHIVTLIYRCTTTGRRDRRLKLDERLVTLMNIRNRMFHDTNWDPWLCINDGRVNFPLSVFVQCNYGIIQQGIDTMLSIAQEMFNEVITNLNDNKKFIDNLKLQNIPKPSVLLVPSFKNMVKKDFSKTGHRFEDDIVVHDDMLEEETHDESILGDLFE